MVLSRFKTLTKTDSNANKFDLAIVECALTADFKRNRDTSDREHRWRCIKAANTVTVKMPIRGADDKVNAELAAVAQE